MTFESFFISLIHVGEVTLISIKYFPIMSIPTKNSFLFLNSGPIASQINLSDLEINVFLAEPPTWILDRISSFLGTLAKAPTGSPSISIILLSPNFISGNCYDARQYGDYSLYCPYAYRLPNGTILAKDLAAEYNYLGNSSIWFYNARRKAQEIIDNNAPIYRGINGVTPLNIVFSFINYL